MKKHYYSKYGNAGFAIVFNYVKPKGSSLPRFYHSNRRSNFMDKEGNLLGKDWWFDCRPFHYGFAAVFLTDGRSNYINTKGEYLSKTFFHGCDDFNKYGIAKVSFYDSENGYTHNLINLQGKLLLPKNVREIYPNSLCEPLNLCAVEVEMDKWNVVDTKGNYVLNNFYEWAMPEKNGLIVVKKDNKYNFIKSYKDGDEMLSEQWFDFLGETFNGFTMIGMLDSKVKQFKFNYINPEGKLVSPTMWFDRASKFEEREDGLFAQVKKYVGKTLYINMLTTDGTLLFNWMRQFNK